MQSEVSELKTDLNEIKLSIEQVAINVHTSNLPIKEEIQIALLSIANTITTLVAQVNELHEKDKKRKEEMSALETRINKLEQW